MTVWVSCIHFGYFHTCAGHPPGNIRILEKNILKKYPDFILTLSHEGHMHNLIWLIVCGFENIYQPGAGLSSGFQTVGPGPECSTGLWGNVQFIKLWWDECCTPPNTLYKTLLLLGPPDLSSLTSLPLLLVEAVSGLCYLTLNLTLTNFELRKIRQMALWRL